MLSQISEPASEIRVGTDINGETVLDFKPAIAMEPIKVIHCTTIKMDCKDGAISGYVYMIATKLQSSLICTYNFPC